MCLDAITLFSEFFGPRYVDLEYYLCHLHFFGHSYGHLKRATKLIFTFGTKQPKTAYFQIAEKSKNDITP